MQRTQIYLSSDQQKALSALAVQQGVTASALIRDAIDGYLAGRLGPEERLTRLRELGARFQTRARTASFDSAAVVDNLRSADASRLDSPE